MGTKRIEVGSTVSFKAKPGEYFTVREITPNRLVILQGHDGAFHKDVFEVHEKIPIELITPEKPPRAPVPTPVKVKAPEITEIARVYAPDGSFRYAVRGYNEKLDPDGTMEFLIQGLVAMTRVLEAQNEDRRGRTWADVLKTLERAYQESEDSGRGFDIVHHKP